MGFFDLNRGRRRPPPSPSPTDGVFVIPILVACYFPARNGRLDRSVTGDVDAGLSQIRRHTEDTTLRVIDTLQKGSAHHGYKDAAAQPCVRYRIVERLEYLEPVPTWSKPGHHVPMTDYNSIMAKINVQYWVRERGVKEIWLWGYHGGLVDLWESNMAGPFGDISNSDRDQTDLPVLDRTYTVYHYNYGRGVSEAVEDHIHQIEAVLGQVDHELFWGRFVGRTGEGRCGWAHYPPNGRRDYDWANPEYVESDIEDWRPDGTGQKQRMNCTRWNCDSLPWFTYWMQNIPGADRGRRLTNWWSFIGDFDAAMSRGTGLTE